MREQGMTLPTWREQARVGPSIAKGKGQGRLAEQANPKDCRRPGSTQAASVPRPVR